jgi:hypothetical protein
MFAGMNPHTPNRRDAALLDPQAMGLCVERFPFRIDVSATFCVRSDADREKR